MFEKYKDFFPLKRNVTNLFPLYYSVRIFLCPCWFHDQVIYSFEFSFEVSWLFLTVVWYWLVHIYFYLLMVTRWWWSRTCWLPILKARGIRWKIRKSSKKFNVLCSEPELIYHRKIFRSSHWKCSVRKGFHRNFAKFTEIHLCQSLF